MILPIGHDAQSSGVRRLPWITFIIMGLCIIVHFFVSQEMHRVEKRLEESLKKMFIHYFAHPYLELDPEFEKRLFATEEQKKIFKMFLPKETQTPPMDEDVWADEQDELDRLTDEILNLMDNIPFRKYGMTPANKSFLTLLTHMFLHGDWLHLVFNLLFLYLTGPFIEDVWGRSVYVVFYLLAGLFAGQLFSMHYPNSTVPLIGASGAIAGVMGAFLIRHWRVKIKFVYIFTILLSGTFKAPAWLMLPLWFGLEYFNAQVMDKLFPGGGGGVAHWAHIWGFVFGALVGIGIKFFDIEEKFLRPKIEEKTVIVDKGYEKFEEAKHLLDDGKIEEAFPLMLEAARVSPGDIEICGTLWELGQHLGREREASRAFLRLIEHEIRDERFDAALSHYKQLRAKIPDARLHNQMTLVLVEHLVKKEEGSKDAEELTNELVDSLDVNAPPGFLLQFSGVAMALSSSLAEKAIGLALRHPEVPAARKEELQAKLGEVKRRAEVGGQKTESPEERLEALLGASDYEPQRVGEEMYRLTRIVKASRAVPLSLKKDAILLHVDKVGERTLSFDRVRAISLVKIAPPQGNPFLLLDLFLSDPTTAPVDQEIRTIRLSSSEFSPQKFVPKAAGLKEAFQSMLNYLLKASGAKPYPDLDAVMLKRKLDVFSSIEDYEASLPTPPS